MKPGNALAEDMFERAREAFFGTAKTLPEPNTPSTEFIKLRNESSPEEVTGPCPEKHGAAQAVVFSRRNV